MPKNAYGDKYSINDYNGDPSYGGRINTKKEKAEKKGEAWMENFADGILPSIFPEITNYQETFSSPSEIGEYRIDRDKNENGRSTIMCEVAVLPERYAQLEHSGWEELLNEFSKIAVDFESNIYSNNDDPELPTITFEITV